MELIKYDVTYVVQQLLKTEMPMNTGRRPEIQPFCKSIECSGGKPIRMMPFDKLRARVMNDKF